MTWYAIDAPTLVHIIAHDLTVSPRHQLVAPNGVRSHALSLLLGSVRDGELTEEVALKQHERQTGLKIRLLGDRASRRTAWKIAREHGWDNIFDSEYLAVAKLQADALVTVDSAMAAKADGVVPVASLDALLA